MPIRRTLESPKLVCWLLGLATLAAYLPVVYLNFLSYDDYQYVSRNPHVLAGLTWNGLGWALTHYHAGNWHPVTWLSHMLDCQFFGLRPAGHHVMNLVFHVANSLLLFLLLRLLTGAFWRSAMVAALFALHPLHVESVAWVAERKDVLSTFFFLLTLMAYRKYVASAGSMVGRRVSEPASWYLLALVLFALGLMSKPMLVTTPFVLLLLDYWPLQRFEKAGSKAPRSKVPEGETMEHGQRTTLRARSFSHQTALRLLGEKLPFFALSAASCVVTVFAQRAGGAVVPWESLPLEPRLLNAIDAYFRYLGKLIWPSDLAVIYTFADSHAASEAPLAGLVLLAITSVVLWQRRRRPYLPMGWGWYLGMLVPVIGLLQVGNQAMADRYLYLPAVGIFIICAWGGAEVVAARPRLRVPMVGAAGGVLLGCLLTTQAQLRHWQNSETLFRRALAATGNNFVAWFHLGFELAEQGQYRQAEACYRRALAIHPVYQQALNNLASSLVAQKRYDEAIINYEAALRLAPGSPVVRANYAEALAAVGQSAAAVTQYREALRLDPSSSKARHNLAGLLARDGKLDEAVAEYRRVLQLEPGLSESRLSLGSALAEQGHDGEAIQEFSILLKAEPTNAPARLELGMVLLRQGKADEAIAQFAELLKRSPNDATAHFQLAEALAKQRRFEDSVRHYRAALDGLPDSVEALNNLAWILAANVAASLRNGPEAVRLAERACKLTDYKQPVLLGTLAAAYAECGRFSDATDTAERARTLADQANEPDVAARNGQLLQLYRGGKPARDQP